MRKQTWTALLLTFFVTLFMSTSISFADEKTPENEFRVGMEAAYAPSNWTQTTDAHGAVPIFGQKNAYAGGYDVKIAKDIAKGLNKELVVVQMQWDGLVPALQSGKIDAIIAGMSPTAERREQIDFSDPYFNTHFVVMTKADSPYAKAKTLADFKDAKITAQLNTKHYELIDQMPDVAKQQAQKDFSSMRVALSSGIIDGYISDRSEGVTAMNSNPNLKMVEFADGDGFTVDTNDVTTAIGMRKNDPDMLKVNEVLATIPTEQRDTWMNEAIAEQPSSNDTQTGLIGTFKQILNQYGGLFLRGAGLTLVVAIISTIVGTFIGLLIGVFRTLPESENPIKRAGQKVLNTLLTIYIEVFRGTPMMVQAMVIFYGLALAFQIDLNRTFAAILIVSINTGAYMSEIVRGGIYAVDKGQFEAAQAIGMTHSQTMRKVVLPQVMRNILPATGNEIIINIKDTAVLSVISVGDLFFQGTAAAGTNLQFFPTFTIIGIMYLIMTVSATQLLKVVERKMDGPQAYVQIDETEQTN